MSVIKPYKSKSVVRNHGYDDVGIYALQEQNRESSDRLNDYITRRQKDEWMSEDELNGYRDALERYKTSSRSLSNIQRSFGSYSDEDEKQRTSYIDSIAADLDSSSGMFKSYKNADEYGAAVKAYDTQKRQEAWKEAYKGKTYKELSDYVRSVDYQKQRRMGDISDEEDNWLKNTYMKHDRDVVDSMTEDEIRKAKEDNDNALAKLNNEISVLEMEKAQGYTRPRYEQEMEALKKKERDSSVLYFDEDDAAMTYDSLLRIKKAENTLQNIESENTSKEAYDRVAADEKEIGYFDTVARALSSATIDDRANLRTDEEKQAASYLGAKYGLDFSQPASYLLQRINDEFIQPLYDQKQNDIQALSALGYDWNELAYYNKWKADKASYKQRVEAQAQNAIDHPIASTIFGILASPLQAVDLVKNAAYTTRSGGDSAYGLANIYDDDLTNQIKTSSSAVAGKINEDVKNWTGSDALAWLASGAYSGVTSSLQSHALNAACVALFGPAGEAIALGLMGTQSAANAFQDAVMNGSNNGQALATSIAAGIAEAAFEKISLEKIKGIKDLVNSKSWNTSTLRDLLKSALRNTGIVAVQGVVEGSEELCTDIANALADDVINGDHSAYKTDIMKYMNAGYSREEAEQMANKNWIMGVMESFYGGFIGGAMSGSLQMAANVATGMPQAIEGSIDKYHGIRSYGASIIENDNIQRLTESAQDTGSKRLRALAEQVAGVDTSASDFTEKSRDRLVRDTGRLFYGVQEAQTKALDQAAKGDFTAKVRDALSEQGVDNLDKATEAVMRSVEGKELSRAEKKLFDAVGGEEVIRTVQGSQMGEQTADAYSQRLSTAALPFVSREDTELGGKKHVDVQDRVSSTGHTVNTDTGENITVNKKNAIDRVENGEVYVNTDKGAVKLGNIEFASENEARLYESFVDYNPAIASALINNYDGSISVERYVNGMRQGINVYGKYNFQGVGIDISKDSFFADLSPTDQQFALKLGRNIAKNEAQAAQMTAAAQTAVKTKGGVRFAEGVTAKTQAQKNGVALAKHLANALGINIEFFDSTKDAKHKNDNGWYDPATDSIHLDINAGDNYEGTVAYTLGHELTHFIKKWSPEKFRVFGDFLVEQYGKHGVNTQELLEAQMAKLNTTDEAIAYEELVADACQTMLLDSNAVEKLAELRHKDKGLFEKIREFIRSILDKLRKDYAGIDPNSEEAKALRSMTDVMEQMTALFEDAAVDAAQAHSGAETLTMAKANEAIAVQDTHSGSVSPESGDISFSIRENANITARTQRYFEQHRDQSDHISEDALKAANDIVAEMARYMEPYLDITNNRGNRYLPEEILGKTTFKNGSYGKTIENTTICFRTLAYIDFTNEIKKRIGRPLTVEESFLASQMLYDIAKEPQCLYCYVSLDRKAYDGFLLEYMSQRDKVIEKYQALESRDKKSVDALYKEFLNGRKDTKPMRKRFDMWVDLAENGQRLIVGADLATEEVRSELLSDGGTMAAQVADAERYAQSASWAKKLEQYRSYNSDILSMSSAMVKKLNKHYGLRFYSFSEYTPAFIVENMQQIRDASVKGLYGLAYTKKPDFARIFAGTGMNINISVFGRMDGGKVVADTLQGADWDEVRQLRKEHKNVGAVFVATNDTMTEWALSQDWIDVVIPFHIVRTGANVAEFYRWVNNTKEQADVDEHGKNKTLTPAEFHNDRDTYMRLIRERGLTPRFSKWIDNPNYMKLVNETRLADTESERLHPTFDLTAAKQSFDAFVKDGGYYGNWYEEGADYGKAVDTVVSDVLAGKRANEVDYGRQDIDFSDAMKNRSKRSHGQKFSTRTQTQTELTQQYQAKVDQILNMQDTAPSSVIIGYTPDLYQRLGMPSLPFVIGSGHVYSTAKTEAEAKQDGNFHKGTHYHGLGDAAVKNIYSALQDPVMILASKDVKKTASPMRSTHSVVAIVDVGQAGKSLLLPIEITAERTVNGEQMDVNVLSSAYERNVSELVREAIALENSGDTGLYYAKKEATTLIPAGVQFPIRIQEMIASDAIIRSFDQKVNRKIADVTQSLQFKRWFGDWQNHPEKIPQALLNKDGTPKVWYHGTNADFTAFNADEMSPVEGSFFFAENREDAEAYGDHVFEVYLSAKNLADYDNQPVEFYKLRSKRQQVEYLKERGYDGWYADMDSDGWGEVSVFSPTQIKSATDNIGTIDGNDPDIRYSKRVTDKKTLEFLNGQETVTTYKAMQLIDGKLYPPMAAKVKGDDGKYHLTNPSELGVWQEAVEDPAHIKVKKNGIGYYTLNKGNGKSIDAAYNPYEHSSNLVLNDQFEEAYQRENIVTVECVIPKSELSGEYKAEFAKDSTGMLDWKSGVVAGKLKDNKRKVYLSRWLKPVRILSDAETAAMYKKVIGNDISVPFNVVTPGLRAELEKLGVIIDYEGTPGYKAHHRGNDSTQSKFSKRSSNERYTYDALVSKPDMTVTELTGKVPGNRADVVYEAKMNAAKIGKFNPKDGSVSVHVEDIDADVVLGTNGLKHSLDRRFSTNAPVTLQAGAIIKNSVKINELTPQKAEASKSYVLIGAATDGNGELYVVRSVVNKHSNELASMDVLYAINAKKGIWLRSMRPGFQGPVTSPTISISTLLDFVNQNFADILPEEVLRHYGHTERPEGDLGQSALYSTRNKSNRELLTEALETTVDTTTPMGQYEAKLLGQYKENIGRLDELQAHLKEVNAEIRALTFGDAPRDPQRLRALKDEKIKTENRIDIYDKKLLRLEATSPLKSVLEREKKRVKQETVTAFRESTKAQKTKSETRRKIKQIAEDFRRRLTRSTEYSYVPKQLAEGIISVCNEIDPTGYDQNSKAAERFRSGQAALLELKAQYDRLRTSSDYDFSSEFNEEFSSSIEALSEAVGDTPLREMSADQMEDVYGILSDIKGMLTDATRQIGLSERISNYEAGQEVIKLMHQIKAKSLTTGALSGFFRNWTENPMRAVREMSAFDPDSRLIKLFDSLNEGRRKMETFRMDAYKEFDALRATKEGEKAFNEAVEKPYDFGLTDVDGNPLKISKMQAMQLVLTWNREQANPNRKHLQTGAIIPDVDLLRKGKYQAAFDNGQQIGMVTQETIASIMDGLSEWDRQYMEAARKLFNETARDAINETTMLTKHRIVAGEKEYIPYTVNEDYIAKDSDNVRFDATIEGMGMLKSVADNAPQMLVMGGLNQVLSKHIDSVGKYYGLAVPIRNWNKVFNMKQTASDGGRSVKSVLRGTWTDAGVKLLDQAVADLQTPRKHDSVKALSYIKSAFVQSTLSSNISVWMKQAASYPTAGAILSNKALTKGLWDYVAKVKDGIRAQDVWDEIDAHTSQHWLRRQGMSMQELAEINQTGGWQNKLNKKLGKMSPMNWIQAMDVGTTAALWYACKAEVDGSKRFETGSEEYWNEVTALYDRVIEETQPMYDSLHRAEITKKQGLGNVIMFQTQPLQNSGILRESAMEYKMAKRRYGSTSEQSKAAGRKFRMAVMSQAASHFVFTAMTLTAQALLHKMNPWKDDDDNLTAKSIAEEFAKEFGANYLGAIVPIFGTMGVSLAEKLFGNSSYDVFSDSVVDKVNSTIDTFAKLKNPSFSAFANAFCEAASYLGIPAQNAYNIVRGFILNVNDIIGADHNAVIRAVEGGNQYNGKSLYEAIVSGDKEWINAIREKNGYKDDSDYGTAAKNALRNNDQRVKEAIKARVTGDSARYQQLRQTIINEGNFEKQIVSDAMNAEYSYFTGKIEDAAKLMKDGDTESSGDIIIALRKRYKGILKQDDIMAMVKRKAGLQK